MVKTLNKWNDDFASFQKWLPDPTAFMGSDRDSRLQPILNHLFLGRVIGNPGAPWHNLREARKMVLDVRDKGICHLGQRVRTWHLRQHEDGGRDARLKSEQCVPNAFVSMVLRCPNAS